MRKGECLARPQKDIREKKHRLPREFYRGEIAIAFTLCIADRKPLFQSDAAMGTQAKACGYSGVVPIFVSLLKKISQKGGCIVPVYCFMPDHVHLIIQGMSPSSDLWEVVVSFKQQSGYWLAKNQRTFYWQKNFYDHILRPDEDLAAQVRYVIDNPVRAGLVKRWEEYPYSGSIGIDLKDVLIGITAG